MNAQTLAFFGNLQGTDLLVIGLIGLLLFGKRLPEVGKNLGQAIVGFKKGLKDTGEKVREGTEELEAPLEESEAKKADAGVAASTVTRPKKMLRPAEEP